MEIWSKLFEQPPSEIQRLMNGFKALRKALSRDPKSLGTSFVTKRDQVHQIVDALKVSQDAISTARSSMVSVTKTLEEKINSYEQALYQSSSRVQELRAQLEKLNSQLKDAEENQAQAALAKEEATRYLTRHNERLAEASLFQSKLDTSSVRSQQRLNKIEEAIANFTDQDEEGLTKHVRPLFDFLTSCTFEP